MTLKQPLALDKAKTADVHLVPTKKFFKAVFVATAPVTKEDGDLLGCGYLFDKHGQCRSFKGNHGLTSEIPTAIVTLSVANRNVPVRAERIASISIFHEAKLGPHVRFRIHLVEDKAKLLGLIELLSDTNKSEFLLTIESAQESMFTAGLNPAHPADGVPDEAGLYDPETSSKRPFNQGKLDAYLATLEVEGGYVAGWELRFKGKTPYNGGDALSKRSHIHASEAEALEVAARDLFKFAQAEAFVVTGRAEEKARAAFNEWMCGMVPALAFEGAGELVSAVSQ